MNWWSYKPYVSVAQRRAKAAREIARRKKKGQTISPIVIAGRAIATTFWGKAWCENLESYSDFSNRLPRGRTYVRNGSVVDLQIVRRKITALVSGSSLYDVTIAIKPCAARLWKSIKAECSGQIGSLVELLQGRLSKGVMEIVTHRGAGLFPKPAEIEMSCSCPDYAGLCKHLAAVLYGVGARLDHQPELLFHLRELDHLELISQACAPTPPKRTKGGNNPTIAQGDLADVFGIEIADSDGAHLPGPRRLTDRQARPRPSKRAKTGTPSSTRGVPETSQVGSIPDKSSESLPRPRGPKKFAAARKRQSTMAIAREKTAASRARHVHSKKSKGTAASLGGKSASAVSASRRSRRKK